MIAWSWQIALYLWLAGMAGGAFCTAFLADRASGRKQKELLQIATWMGVPMVLVGALLLTLELGQGMRFWHLLTEFFTLSPMSIGSWLLLIWAAVGIVLIALWFAEAFESVEQQTGMFARVASWLRPLVPATEVLLWVAFVLSILLVAYTGVLLSATNQPLWSETWLLPALFVVSAISTGIAALIVAVLLRRRTSVRALNLLGRIDPVVTLVELVTLVAFLIGLGATRTVITTGTLGLYFWVGAVLIGVLVPLGLGLRARVRGKESGYEALLAALWSIMGGLVLRAVIVLGGQIYG
jgi:protein NrfD